MFHHENSRQRQTDEISTVVTSWCVRICGDFIPQIPKLPVGHMLHALLQNLYRRPHGPDHPGSYDALRQFQVMEAKNLQPLIEVEHALRHVRQAKELFMPAIYIVNGQALAAKLFLKSLADSGRDMQ